MKPRHQVSRAAIDLIKRFEGYRRTAAQLPDGRWTIGYGHTLTAREGAEVSESDAEALLLYDLIAVAHVVNEQTYTPLTQNQFDALCCFASNIGLDNFRRSSVLRRINEGALLQAACGMELWRKADFAGERIVIDALVRRRAAEKTLFLTPPGGWVPAPSPVLPPKVDYDAFESVPRQAPVILTTALDGDKAVAELDETVQPMPEPPPEEPLASELAAASVAARLEQILPDASEPEPVASEPAEEDSDPPPVASAEEPQPERAPLLPPAPIVVGDIFNLTPPPEVEPQPAAAPEPAEPLSAEPEPSLFESEAANRPEAVLRAQPMIDEAHLRRLVQQDESDIVENIRPPVIEDSIAPGRGGGLLLLGLALMGIALFAGALFWGLSVPADDEGLLTPHTVGWALGLVGVVCFGLSAYLFLDRLGGGGYDEDED